MDSKRGSNFTLIAKSELLSDDIDINLCKDTISSSYTTDGSFYSYDNIAIFEENRITKILLNGVDYRVHICQYSLKASNDNIIIEEEEGDRYPHDTIITGKKPGKTTIEFNIDLGFCQKTIYKEIEILPYAQIYANLFSDAMKLFFPYDGVSKDYYNDDVKQEIIRLYKFNILEEFKIKTGYDAEIVDLYRFGFTGFFPIIKPTLKYEPLEKILINNQDISNDIHIQLGKTLVVEPIYTNDLEPNNIWECHAKISGDDVIGQKNNQTLKKGKARYAVAFIINNIYIHIYEFNVIVE